MKSTYPGITNYLQLKSATTVDVYHEFGTTGIVKTRMYAPLICMALHKIIIEDSGEICIVGMKLILYCARPYLDIHVPCF